jgi:asparagine synthase (glutamine-hydrolysing)
VLESLAGGFSLALIDPDAGEALLAIDRVGGRFPMNYLVDGGRLIFGSRLDAIQAHPAGERDPDPQGLYNYLYFNVVPGPGTIRRDIRRLLPGQFLHLRAGEVRLDTYWRLDYDVPQGSSVEELEGEFHEILRASLRRVSGAKTGCFLSGGTDSSTVAGKLAEVSGTSPRTYSIGFAAAGYDEMKYARIAVERFGTEHHEYYLTPEDVVELVPRITEAYAEPFGNESAVPTYFCGRLARRDGIELMLGGDGGDELFAGNERYSKQQIFGYYDKVPSLLRGMLEPILFHFPGGQAIMPVRKARSYVEQAKIPMPKRTTTYNYLERLGATSILEPDFLEQVDPGAPLALLTEVYNGAGAEGMLNRMLATSMRITIADNDLPKVSRMCEMAGLPVEYPLLTDEMIEFSCRVPERLKIKRHRLRWFFKHALRDFLPPEILTKSKHGFGMPFGLWLRDHAGLRALALDSLSSLRSRGIVRGDFIDNLIRQHEQDHAVYFGVLIWVLMQLELWFELHVDRVPVS